MIPTETAHVFLDGSGTARVEGMRTKVSHIVSDHVTGGLSPAAIQNQYPYLTLAQIHAALAYYFDHQAEIDQQIEEGDRWVAEREARARERQPSRAELEARLRLKLRPAERTPAPV